MAIIHATIKCKYPSRNQLIKMYRLPNFSFFCQVKQSTTKTFVKKGRSINNVLFKVSGTFDGNTLNLISLITKIILTNFSFELWCRAFHGLGQAKFAFRVDYCNYALKSLRLWPPPQILHFFKLFSFPVNFISTKFIDSKRKSTFLRRHVKMFL